MSDAYVRYFDGGIVQLIQMTILEYISKEGPPLFNLSLLFYFLNKWMRWTSRQHLRFKTLVHWPHCSPIFQYCIAAATGFHTDSNTNKHTNTHTQTFFF